MGQRNQKDTHRAASFVSKDHTSQFTPGYPPGWRSFCHLQIGAKLTSILAEKQAPSMPPKG